MNVLVFVRVSVAGVCVGGVGGCTGIVCGECILVWTVGVVVRTLCCVHMHF